MCTCNPGNCWCTRHLPNANQSWGQFLFINYKFYSNSFLSILESIPIPLVLRKVNSNSIPIPKKSIPYQFHPRMRFLIHIELWLALPTTVKHRVDARFVLGYSTDLWGAHAVLGRGRRRWCIPRDHYIYSHRCPDHCKQSRLKTNSLWINCPNVGSLLARRRRRCANSEPALGQWS